MERWQGKVAVVTGASAGIGAVIASELARAGLVTIGLARRPELIEKLKEKLPEESKENLHGIWCDISEEKNVLATFEEIKSKFGGIDVLVNNAGIAIFGVGLLNEENSQVLKDTVNTNIMGLVFCTRETVKSISDRNGFGHVIHINSTSGHEKHLYMSRHGFPLLNIYGPTKYAVTALTEELRQEMIIKNIENIKVTSISPGVVKTDIYNDDEYLENTPGLNSEDIAQAVLYVLGTPPHVQVHEIIIRPMGETV